MRLKNRIAVITGSGRGIGRAIALQMAGEGAKVVVNYVRNEEKAGEVVKEIAGTGGTAVAVKADVSQRDEVRRMMEFTVDRFGKIDILVNNAGILEQKPFASISDAEWDNMMAVNLKGPFICCQECLPFMVQNNFGRIINISSIGGQWGGQLGVHYAAAKAGIISLTRSLAKIYSQDGINTNCIAPGLVLTEMAAAEMETEGGKEKLKSIPLKRPASPEEIARIAVFLAGEDGSYLTGQTINANGGMLF